VRSAQEKNLCALRTAHCALRTRYGTPREPFATVTSTAALYPRAIRRNRVFGGLTERQEHVFTWIAVVMILLYAAAWVGAIAHMRGVQQELIRQEVVTHIPAPPPSAPTQQIAAALTGSTSATAYIDDAMLGFLTPLRGESGQLRFTTRTPGESIVSDIPGKVQAVLSSEKSKEVSADFVAPSKPGVYKLAVQLDQASRAINDFTVITLVPFAEKQRGHIGLYYLGSWPFEKGTPRTPAYANPSGFIEVTQENADTPVSAHFKLRDFLTKDQYNVWPKYMLLNPKLLDKLELTIAELERSGHPVENIHILSGFRTPEYNYTGGNTQGRANLSRHMFGDAADVFIDNDNNGVMDDLNHDGRVDVRDAEVIQQAVERVEKEHPDLVGGVGVYSACCGHGPFTHIDVRGYRARWRGFGNG
jgi:uncharacterized protein YcbK (DUF882 family)